MATVDLDRARMILDRTAGIIPDEYRQLPLDKRQARVMVDLGYHEVLEVEDPEVYMAGLPRIEDKPEHHFFYDALVIDPRIPIEEVLRRGYINYRTYGINPSDFEDIVAEPTEPYIAWFRPGNEWHRHDRDESGLILPPYERLPRLREIATFWVMSPFINKRPSKLVAAGSIHRHLRAFASIDSRTFASHDAKLDFETSTYNLATCLSDPHIQSSKI